MSEVLANLSSALARGQDRRPEASCAWKPAAGSPASGIVWSADEIIVTAHHVIEEDEKIGIGLADGRTVSASLVGRDQRPISRSSTPKPTD